MEIKEFVTHDTKCRTACLIHVTSSASASLTSSSCLFHFGSSQTFLFLPSDVELGEPGMPPMRGYFGAGLEGLGVVACFAAESEGPRVVASFAADLEELGVVACFAWVVCVVRFPSPTRSMTSLAVSDDLIEFAYLASFSSLHHEGFLLVLSSRHSSFNARVRTALRDFCSQ